jgi:esterase/lipase superfamily enzyme
MPMSRSLTSLPLALALLGFTCVVMSGCATDEDAAFSRKEVDVPQEDWETSSLNSMGVVENEGGERLEFGGEAAVPEAAVVPLGARVAQPDRPVPTVPLAMDSHSPASPTTSFPKMAVRSPKMERGSREMAPRLTAPMAIAPSAASEPAFRADSVSPMTSDSAVPRMAAMSLEPSAGEAPPEPMAMEMAAPPEAVAEMPAARTPVAEDRGDYEAVTVFYGTDRSSTATSGMPAEPHRLWLYGAGVCLLLFGLFALVAVTGSRKKTFGGLAVMSFSAGSVMAVLGAIAWLQSDGAVAGPMLEYGNDRGKFVMGTCEVSIPRNHQVAELEAPSVFKLDFVEDPTKHVMLLDVEEKDSKAFFSQLRDRVEQGVSKDAFVFVHGFNVTFKDAARRTAQLAYDLRFQGAPIFYSWPSQGGLFQYAVDETNVVWTVPHLREFLKEVADQSGAQSIHLIAHSMGNRALTSALRELSLEMQGASPLFHEVVLTAPDIDREIFCRDIAPAIVSTARRVTLYASSNDEALVLSKQVHGYPRAGDTGDGLVVIQGIETIDVSAVDTSLLGHNYYGDNATVISDMIDLVRNSKSAQERSWLETARLDDLFYWVFRADRSAVGAAPTSNPSRY